MAPSSLVAECYWFQHDSQQTQKVARGGWKGFFVSPSGDGCWLRIAAVPGWCRRWPRNHWQNPGYWYCLYSATVGEQTASHSPWSWAATRGWARLSWYGLIKFHCRLCCVLCSSTVSARFKLITSISTMTKHCFWKQIFHNKWLFVFLHKNIGLSRVKQFSFSPLPPSLLPDLCV